MLVLAPVVLLSPHVGCTSVRLRDAVPGKGGVKRQFSAHSEAVAEISSASLARFSPNFTFREQFF